MDQIALTEEQMDTDQDKFYKKLLDDQLQLEDRLDSVQMIVAGFAGRTDLSKAAEIANEVRRVMKDLKDCQQQAALYNQRERLFERPVTQVHHMCIMLHALGICRDNYSSGRLACQSDRTGPILKGQLLKFHNAGVYAHLSQHFASRRPFLSGQQKSGRS